jgi:hypothetical protein
MGKLPFLVSTDDTDLALGGRIFIQPLGEVLMLAEAAGFRQESGLGVLQIATADQDTLQYKSSAAAIKEGLLEVREISEGGTVKKQEQKRHQTPGSDYHAE